MKDLKKFNGRNYTKLNSVGSLIDCVNGLIYPQIKVNGEPDLSFEINLFQDDVSKEWYDSLSLKDLSIVQQVLNKNQ
tara:strand:+ start:65 stop:295 length:231 start_codon:yes stop_codon:yes gene_type:complete